MATAPLCVMSLVFSAQFPSSVAAVPEAFQRTADAPARAVDFQERPTAVPASLMATAES